MFYMTNFNYSTTNIGNFLLHMRSMLVEDSTVPEITRIKHYLKINMNLK